MQNYKIANIFSVCIRNELGATANWSKRNAHTHTHAVFKCQNQQPAHRKLRRKNTDSVLSFLHKFHRIRRKSGASQTTEKREDSKRSVAATTRCRRRRRANNEPRRRLRDEIPAEKTTGERCRQVRAEAPAQRPPKTGAKTASSVVGYFADDLSGKVSTTRVPDETFTAIDQKLDGDDGVEFNAPLDTV